MRALLDGRFHVSFEDVRRVYLPAMRHRVILNFEGEAEGIDTDHVLTEILKKVPEKARTRRWQCQAVKNANEQEDAETEALVNRTLLTVRTLRSSG